LTDPPAVTGPLGTDLNQPTDPPVTNLPSTANTGSFLGSQLSAASTGGSGPMFAGTSGSDEPTGHFQSPVPTPASLVLSLSGALPAGAWWLLRRLRP
jgi:hypothetical protein